MSAVSTTDKNLYTVVVNFDPLDNVYYATIPTLGIVTDGSSYDEALWMAEDAITGWLQVAREDGLPIPDEDTYPVLVQKIGGQSTEQGDTVYGST